MGIFKKKQKPPTADQLAKIDRKAHITTTEAEDMNRTPDGVAFDYQVIDDENMLALFHPSSPNRLDWLDPLFPFFSRLNYLTNCSQKEARLFKMKVRRTIKILQFRRKDEEEKDLLDSLLTHFSMRINDSVEGFKLNTLTERKRRIRIEEEQVKKGRWPRR